MMKTLNTETMPIYERMRKAANVVPTWSSSPRHLVALNELADEVEREIRQNYAPLPCYEDKEQVRLGGYVDGLDGKVVCITIHIEGNGDPWYQLLDDTGEIEGTSFKRPVLNADGEPIKVGETAWCTLFGTKVGGKRFEVVDIKPAEEAHDTFAHIIVKDEEGEEHTFFPGCLTHHEPDSLLKLRDDIDSFMRDCEINADKVDEYSDRITAFIERYEPKYI